MDEPMVSCVMPTSPGREKMRQRAIRGFNSQTYKNRELIVLPSDGRTIGALRNAVNALATGEIIAHFDDDDWSHPNRLAEQVVLLLVSRAEAVGYSQAVFWHERGEAYTYTGLVANTCIVGASLMYWRKAWDRVPFDDIQHGSDTRFVRRVKAQGCSGLNVAEGHREPMNATVGGLFGAPADPFERFVVGPLSIRSGDPCDPRIICAIHAGSTTKGTPNLSAQEWKRAPQFDKYCAERMNL